MGNAEANCHIGSDSRVELRCSTTIHKTYAAIFIDIFISHVYLHLVYFQFHSSHNTALQSTRLELADLVGESKVNAKWREDEALERLSCGKVVAVLGDGRDVRVIQVDEFPVVFDTRGSNRFGEDGGATGN